MRVALLDPPSYTPPYDHSLAAALARRGHAVDLVTSRFPFGATPEPDGYRRHEPFFPLSARLLRHAPRSRARVAVKGLEYLPSVAMLLRRIDSLEPDVVHVQWLPAPRLDLRWLRVIARARPTVFTAHDALRQSEGNMVAVWREVFGTVDGIVVHSRQACDRLRSLGVEPRRIAHVRHGAFEAPVATAAARPRGANLLFFGLLRAYKGLDVLVRALADVARDVPEVRLVVAGDPVDAIEPVRELAAALGVADRVQWRLGFLPDREISELMQAASVVILPYRKGDASGVLATAIGHGRPAVVSDLGSLGETVREFGAGRVVPPGDASALAAACTALLREPEALDRAFEGAQAARKALSWDAAAEAHERLYEVLLAQRAASER